jgi:hypothetical protein
LLSGALLILRLLEIQLVTVGGNFVTLDLTIEGGEFYSQQPRGARLVSRHPAQRATNQIDLEALHFIAKADRAV